MNVCKLMCCDIYQGIIKNRRFLVVPILCFFECMYNDNLLAILSNGSSFGKITIFDLFTLVFRGNDPISKLPKDNSLMELPYFWIAIFVFAVFIGFEYMHNDLTQFGTQILTRCRKRESWWLSKCIWCIAATVWCYILIIGTIFLYGVLHDFILTPENNYKLTDVLTNESVVYESASCKSIGIMDRLCIIIAPLTVILALNMIQMTLCLVIKPVYSYIISVVLIIAGTFSDSQIAFTRSAMVLYNMNYLKKGYNTHVGIIICLTITALCMIIGGIYFKKTNILPDKE